MLSNSPLARHKPLSLGVEAGVGGPQAQIDLTPNTRYYVITM